MISILLVDDDPQIQKLFVQFLRSKNIDVVSAISGEEALKSLENSIPDMILLDLSLPGISGLECLEKIKKDHPVIPVVIVTGYAELSTAVKAMKLGSRDYIEKPVDLEDLYRVIKTIVQPVIEPVYNKIKEDQLSEFGYGDLIGVSQSMQDVFRFILKVTNSPTTPVLIYGETGTGKGHVARTLHYYSERSDKPFIEINCTTFQETLLEAELFGYEAGAFTDAKRQKKGLLELAHGGTFFLDEIGEMSLWLQAKILKVIEEQTFRRVGGTVEIKVDARIISATSKKLEQKIIDGTFREDLFYRLNVARVNLPPVRERKDDIILLVEHFIDILNPKLNKQIKGISPEAADIIINYEWPGNVREIRNIIERAILFEKGDWINEDSLGQFSLIRESVEKSQSINIEEIVIPESGISIEKVEQALIKQALKMSKGNKSRAATLLGLSRATLNYRLKKFNIEY
jgi:DNA-binding NtrC family response regulator